VILVILWANSHSFRIVHSLDLIERFLFTTTNANPIKQAGGSRRVLVVPVARRESEETNEVFRSMGECLVPALLVQRSALWKELLGDLARCVLAMHHTRPDTATALSMADFGVFLQRCADYEGWGEQARAMVRTINARQEDQSAQARIVLDLMTELLRTSPTLQGKELTAKDWVERLQKLIPDHDVELVRKVNKSYFAWEIKTFSDLFTARLGMVASENKHSKTKTYAFRLKEGKIVNITEVA
jgi:hypothetical protein